MGKDKKQKKPVSRKEARKLDRQQAKQAKNLKHQVKTEAKQAAGPLQKILLAKKAQSEPKELSSKSTAAASASKKAPPLRKDPYIEAEELELARLSKLLGIDKSESVYPAALKDILLTISAGRFITKKEVPRKKAADKLNKEFDLFEGMGDGFGDFLMELDDLTDMVEGKSDRKAVFHGRDADNEEDDRLGDRVSRSKQASKYGGHLIDEDEQEQSDIDEDVEMSGSDYDEEEDDMDGEESEGSEGEGGSDIDMDQEEGEGYSEDSYEGSISGSDEGEEEDLGSGSDGAPPGDEPEGEGEGSEAEDGSGSDGGSEDRSEGEEADEGEDAQAQYTYRPAKGEDIYGRSVAADGPTGGQPGKYVPPALRNKAAQLTQINENSENVQQLKRQLNGLMNKLSDQSKDSIVRAIKVLFDKNSVTVATLVLKDAIFAACAHPTQVMTTLIPIYAAIVAALHNSVSIDVGAVLVEHLATALVRSLAEATAAAKAGAAGKQVGDSQSASYIGTKLPANALLLLVYLYNLRVVHHTLIVDVMNALADHVPATGAATTGASVPQQAAGLGDFVELKVELLEHLINHCGTSIRSDDPVSLRAVISTLTKRLANAPMDPDQEGAAGSSRLRFMSEALTDLKNNKSRRIQTANAEVVKKLRKWLGSVKAALGQKQAGDTCLRVTLQDLLNAETKGRWWRTGASWVGKQQADAEREEQARKDAELARATTTTRPKSAPEKTEEEKLMQLAAKMRMNTTARKNIFVVMMSSRDVTDAFERLSRLELKGKEDREVARVLAQCCAQERTYNAFYAELAKMLCAQHRQYKITFQFVFWDAFKAMEEAEDEEGEAAVLAERRAVNLARLLAALVCSFHLPLTVIKPIDIATMSGNMVLFLSTLLLALFKEKITEEDYQNVLDRVATSRDFAVVRDNILFFLQKYLPSIPKGLPAEDAKKMSQRRKTAIRTFEAMSVLDISKGMMRDEEL